LKEKQGVGHFMKSNAAHTILSTHTVFEVENKELVAK